MSLCPAVWRRPALLPQSFQLGLTWDKFSVALLGDRWSSSLNALAVLVDMLSSESLVARMPSVTSMNSTKKVNMARTLRCCLVLQTPCC